MLLPEILREAISDLYSRGLSEKEKIAAFEKLSLAYKHSPSEAFSHNQTTLAYLITRLPATFAVIVKVLEIFFIRTHATMTTFLDLGSGPATSLWALEVFGKTPEKAVCVEKNPQMMKIAQELIQRQESPYPIVWLEKDLAEVGEEVASEVVLLSYVLNELNLDASEVFKKLEKLSKKYIILIEPGTPDGYERLMQIRDLAIEKGWSIVAPCPHSQACPLSQTKSWCHFYARVQRSREHRLAKQASLGFEDEKFSFLILQSLPVETVKPAVILSFPKRHKGFIELDVCDPSGERKEVKIVQKNKAAFKKAKKLDWGDFIQETNDG